MSAAFRHTLAVIIATKDHPQDLRRTLASLQAQSVQPCQAILADGGVRTVEEMAREFPRLPIVYRRIWPPSGVRQQNLAVNDVDLSADLIGFVDDDIVLEPGALEAMLAFWETAPPDVGGAVFNFMNNIAPPSAVWLKSLFGMDSVRPGVVLRSGYQTRIGAVSETRAVSWLNSGAVVWRRQVWETWRLDEWFGDRPHLCDVDFSFRVGRRFRLMVVAQARVREVPDPSRRRDDEMFGRWQVANRLYFASKHPELSLARCCWALIGQTLVNLVRGVLERDRRRLLRARGNLAGWWHVVRHRDEVLACHADAERPLRNGCRGIPRLLEAGPSRDRLQARTAERYGYLWRRSVAAEGANGAQAYHFDRMQERLALPPLQGLVLDAGCGDGTDLANQARRPGVEVVGVELSFGGCRASAARCRGVRRAFVVQGDLSRLPFGDDAFNFIYSYGVLHHLPDPAAGLRELVRVLKPGARVAVYLYEDFSDRRAVWRWLLGLVNALRPVTTRMPSPLLEALCRAAAPLVFLACVLPSRVARRIPGGSRLAAAMPFRHAQDPWSLWGDLYDRFATPIERRYSRAGAMALLREAGLKDVAIANDRGWMVAGSKPLPHDEPVLVPVERMSEGAMHGG